MNMLRLQSPVYTIDDELLLPQGTVLSSPTMDILVSSGKTVSPKKFSLLRHGTVKKDIRHFLGLPPYDMIFSGKGKITALFDLMSKVQ